MCKAKIMNKTERLFALLQLLREYRYPISGKVLADKLTVSLRTLYRDIAELQAQGADIQGEAGLGFQLKPGFMLPPLMFDTDEVEALTLGLRWLMKKTDRHLQNSAARALSKLMTALPEKRQKHPDELGLMVAPSRIICGKDDDLLIIRKAIQKSLKIKINYCDVNEKTSLRIIYPLGICYFEKVRIIVAWCELRQDFRHFRTNRVKHIEQLHTPYTPQKRQLLKRWRKQNNIPEQ